jgi:Glycosyl hydrolase family 10
MGNLRFKVTNPQGTDAKVWQTAYITGMEQIPWQCRHSISGDQFIIGRELDESGKVNMVWPTQAYGNICLSTTSLRQSSTPYCLVVEIARGTLSRLKTQTSEWQRMGMKLPDSFYPLAEGSTRDFLRAVTSADGQQQEQLAQSSIEAALQASTILCEAFAQQALESRRQNEGRLTTLLGATLPTELALTSISEGLQKTFNLVNIKADLGSVEQPNGSTNFTPYDTQIQWASQNQFKVCVGPMVDFRHDRLPQWMFLLDENYESILRSACQHAENTVERYRGKAHIWNCAAGLNSPNKLHWNDEEVLRMAVSIIETVRRADSRTPVLLSIDQPWSEYLRDNEQAISPLHFADALIRADLGLSGICLELSMDCWPGGSMPRDLIELNRLIDRWSMLGLPLLVQLSTPTEPASGDTKRVAQWQTRRNQSPTVNQNGSPGYIPPEPLIQLLASKPSIHGIVWDQLTDQFPTATATSGLWNQQGRAKPLLSHLLQLRKTYLH